MRKSDIISVARCAAFGALGVVFLVTAWNMPRGVAQTVWNVIGALDLLYAGWIAARLLRR